jgi:Cd2+/Zn2+-exporting ATPase
MTALSGRGVRGESGGDVVWIGSRGMFAQHGLSIPDAIAAKVDELEAAGTTTMLVQRGEQLLGVLALADLPRDNAAATMHRLAELGVERFVMLTGDNEKVARAIAQQVGIDEVRAGLLPEDKLAAVRDIMRRYGNTAMVGDGVNDAPALASATVGIAMGAAGTDVALETADVALMGDDLSGLPFAVGLGRATRRIVRESLVLSFGVVAVLLPLSLLGIAGIGVAIVFHEGSTLLVVANALRLLRYGRGDGGTSR